VPAVLDTGHCGIAGGIVDQVLTISRRLAGARRAIEAAILSQPQYHRVGDEPRCWPVGAPERLARSGQ